jgi:hypothetical protein
MTNCFPGHPAKHRSGSGWDDSEDVPFDTQWSDFAPGLTPDGLGINFFSKRPGGEAR